MTNYRKKQGPDPINQLIGNNFWMTSYIVKKRARTIFLWAGSYTISSLPHHIYAGILQPKAAVANKQKLKTVDMATTLTSSHRTQVKPGARPVLTQAQNNTTLWIGHLHSDPVDHFAGQTFQCPIEGILDNIQVYSSMVQTPGEMLMTLHEFDNNNKEWGPSIANATLSLNRTNESMWVRFDLQPVTLKKDAYYGFRLQTPNALIGIGEAASGTRQPFLFGNEWHGDSNNQQGHYFTYRWRK